MNITPGLISNPLVAQQPSVLYEQQSVPLQAQWNNNNNIYNYQLPLQMSQYYNVFPEIPSTKTSWTFPNGCVTSSIVRFTGAPTLSYPMGQFAPQNPPKGNGMLPTKRKSLVPDTDNDVQPNKMFISEEKMAARMNGMHISNDFVSHAAANFPSVSEIDGSMEDELPVCVNKSTSQPQLVVCDELKKLNKEMDNILPEPLIPFDKPTTALVLWRPPLSYLNVVQVPPKEKYPPRSSVIITDITDRPDLDNNNIATADLNTIPSVQHPQDEDEMEVMEI